MYNTEICVTSHEIEGHVANGEWRGDRWVHKRDNQNVPIITLHRGPTTVWRVLYCSGPDAGGDGAGTIGGGGGGVKMMLLSLVVEKDPSVGQPNVRH